MANKELEHVMQQISGMVDANKAMAEAAEKLGLAKTDQAELDAAFMDNYGHTEEQIVGMLRGSSDRAAIASVCSKVIMHLEDQVPTHQAGTSGA
jgi:hypothetical protein